MKPIIEIDHTGHFVFKIIYTYIYYMSACILSCTGILFYINILNRVGLNRVGRFKGSHFRGVVLLTLELKSIEEKTIF